MIKVSIQMVRLLLMLPKPTHLPITIIIVIALNQSLHASCSLSILHVIAASTHILIHLGNQWLPLMREVGVPLIAIIIVVAGEASSSSHHSLLVLRSDILLRLLRSHLLVLLELIVPIHIHAWRSIRSHKSL